MVRKKVLLVTLQDANIGNRLQNIALQTILKKYDCIVWTPIYKKTIQNSFIHSIKEFIKIVLGLFGIKKYALNFYFLFRRIRFCVFNFRYISNGFKIQFSKAFKKKWNSFDFAITGSDQVWHKWSDSKYELPYFYLEFMPKDKRIAYAPSFGFDEFSKSNIKDHEKGLEGIKFISCREKRGKQLIYQIVKKDAIQVLDPTLLLKKEEWKSIEKKSKLYHGEAFVLVYFLGDKTNEYKKAINILATENKLEIIDIYDKKSLASMLTTPDEFVWLIEHAEFVCTDSFHACVFSIIFRKKFMAFKRCEPGMDRMFDRIIDLFDITGIDREYKNDISKIYDDFTVKDFSTLQKCSIDFLKNALGIMG